MAIATRETEPFRFGSMGLAGLWEKIGNSSAMLIVAVVLFLSIWQIRAMHQEGMDVLQKLHEQERDFNRLTHEANKATLEKNTRAINALVTELQRDRVRNPVPGF